MEMQYTKSPDLVVVRLIGKVIRVSGLEQVFKICPTVPDTVPAVQPASA